MKLFILYQSDIWKTKSSRIYCGIFDSREKAIDCAKYNGLYSKYVAVIVEEVTLNQIQQIENEIA